MRKQQWLSDDARQQVTRCIQQVEAATGAEVVATVAVRSGHYRHADTLFGGLCGLAALLAYLYYPKPLLDDVAVALIIAITLVATTVSANVGFIRRVFVSRKTMNEAVRTSARARFVDQEISSTRARTGVLVFVSLFERRVEVVPDIGIPVQALGAKWVDAVAALETQARSGVGPFAAGLAALGEVLAEAVPKQADDQNELPDEVVRA